MEENNKIIAEFMGYKIENKKYQSLHFHSSNESDWVWEEGDIVTRNGSEVSDPSQEPYFSLEDLPFNSDWNLLIEVVEKIENTKIKDYSISTDITDDKTFISVWHYGDGSKWSILISNYNEEYKDFNKIQRTYKAVIEFINFYNKQKEE